MMAGAGRKIVAQIKEIFIVTYIAVCALLCIPFVVVLSLREPSIAPQSDAVLVALLYGVLGFVSLALVSLVCATIKKPHRNQGEVNVAR